jgi:hypothetical protein
MVRASRCLADFQDLESIGTGHDQIGDHKIKTSGVHGCKGLFTISRLAHFEIILSQFPGDTLKDERFIINEQYFFVSASTCSLPLTGTRSAAVDRIAIRLFPA